MFLIKSIITFINPILIIPTSLYLYKGKRRSSITAFWLSFAFGYLAYWAQAYTFGDIERYMQLLPMYHAAGFVNSLNFNYEGLVGINLLFWCCSQFNNPRILVFIAAFIMYYNIFYVVFHYCEKEKVSYRNTLLLVFFIMMTQPMYKFISSIRSSIALSIISIALFREYYECKRDGKTYTLYILGILFHDGALAIVALRIIFTFLKKYKKLFCCLILMGLFLVSRSRIILLYLPQNRFTRAVGKIVSFSSEGTQSSIRWAQIMKNSLLARTYQVYTLIAFALILYIYIINQRKDVKKTKNYYDFIIIIMFFIIGMMFFSTSLYIRYVSGMFPLIITLAYKVCIEPTEGKISSGKYSLSQVAFILLAIIGVVLQIYDLSNSVELTTYFGRILKGVLNFIQ